MPARRLGSEPISVAACDVLGFDSPQQAEFVGHVGLASQALTLSAGMGIRVTHMVPPFLVNALDHLGQCHGAAGLEEFRIRRIESFIKEVRSEYKAEAKRRQLLGTWNSTAKTQFEAAHYTIHPHVRWPNEDRPYHQFSCSGFVQEAYAEADVVLVEATKKALPPCHLASLRIAYSHLSSYLDDMAFRTEMGISGDGPWPVLLPGYILNSLNRAREELLAVPYQPSIGDEFFPPRPNRPRTSPLSALVRKLSQWWESMRRAFSEHRRLDRTSDPGKTNDSPQRPH